MNKPFPNYIDIETRAREAGFRNFISFVVNTYYVRKLSLKKSGKIIGVSATKVKTSLKKRGFELRGPGPIPGTVPKKKRIVDIRAKTRENTSFIFPWCAFYILYEKYFLTTYEVGKVLGISQTLVCKFLRKYKIKIRKQGTRRFRRKK